MERQLARIFAILERIEARIINQGAKTMAQLDSLIAQVTQNTTVEASAVALIQGIATQLASATDMAQVNDLTAKLKASADALGAAITANTPAAPPAP